MTVQNVLLSQTACLLNFGNKSWTQTHDNKIQKPCAQYLSKVSAEAEGWQFNCEVWLEPPKCWDDSGLHRLWSSLPEEVAFSSGASPSVVSCSSSDCVRDRDRSLALLSDRSTSELGVMALSPLPEWEHTADYHLVYSNPSEVENKLSSKKKISITR